MTSQETNDTMRQLLIEALEWLNDYNLRMAGSAKLADKIETFLNS